ncbi:MAG: sigma-70 family RNA polymerase sigma factor [bacterium]|nr:sigma-70 family RNA polymerase sigma factor [bacterium]
MKNIEKDLNILELYLSDINSIEKMSEKDQENLKQEYINTDLIMRNKIIESLLPFVACLARKYAKNENELMELIQEGNIGLIEAIDRFDMSKSTKFSTYAYFYIINRIIRYYRKDNAIELSMHDYNKLKRIKKYINEYTNSNGKYPTYDEISNSLKIKSLDIFNLIMLDSGILDINEECNYLTLNYIFNLDKLLDMNDLYESFDNMFMVDLILKEEDFCEKVISKETSLFLLKKMKECLTEREYDIFVSRNLYNMSISFIANNYNLSSERIRQILDCSKYKILKKFKKWGVD